MAYIINVARRNPVRHIFRTAEDSITTSDEGILICRRLAQVYPPEVYTIDLRYEERRTRSDQIDWTSKD